MNECLNCEGTGWTKEGWDKANKLNGGIGPENPFKGDCKHCNGLGVIPELE